MNLNEIQERSREPESDPVADDHESAAADLDEEQPPSDSEWVSPFTVLPPLPKLRKNRQLLRSPEERLHQRNNSSAYYAAAWGSPYATPSPNRSPTRKENAGRDLLSPLSAKHSRFQSIAAPSGLTELDRSKDFGTVAGRARSSSWDRLKSQQEGRHWLSESSGSEVEEKLGKTPTRRIYSRGVGIEATTSGNTSITAKRHQVHESASTITPDTFHGIAGPSLDNPSVETMEPTPADELDSRRGSSPVDKPLPELPLKGSTAGDSVAIIDSNAEPSVRPVVTASQSFRKDKKKVPWKGKTCVIAFPLSDREADGLPPLLTAREVKERLQKWIDLGYDIDGFTVSENDKPSLAASSQSRALYPDPAEMYAERKNGQLHVHIPDQSEWEAWVEYLKEEKLRALGVTPSNSEAPQSTQSPFSSTLSRVSSAFPSLAPSPPISALSNNTNQIRIASNTFSPPISHPSHNGSHMASPLGSMQGSMHGYKGSLAFPRMTSPFDYPATQPNIFNQGMRRTPNGVGQRQYSPSLANVPSLSQILSPVIPSAPTVPSNDGGRGVNQNTSMEQIRQQQQRQQQIHSQMLQQQHKRQQSLFPQPVKSAELPRTPNALASPTRSTPEIMHPTPRSHRHNLSAALQKGVDDAEAARNVESSALLSERLQNIQNDGVRKPVPVEEETEDQDQEELPVLKRPETLGKEDDASDIETNPSLSASPLLMDDKNPLATMSTLKDVLEKQTPQKQLVGHKPGTSLSKFNVDAPEFSPSKPPSTAGFSFNPVTASAFVPTHSNNPSLSRLTHTSKAPSLSRFNVDAPAFTPSFIKQATPQDSLASTPIKESFAPRDPTPLKNTPAEKPVFTFSSPFNVEAPEFKPTAQAFSFDAPEFVPSQAISFAAQRVTPIFQAHHASAGSIFGDVTIDPLAKVNRRNTKALPIVPPKSREGTPMENTDVDEEGRVRAPSERQKRARRVDDDGDQAPRFADSAPFDPAEGLAVRDQSSRLSTPSKALEHEETEGREKVTVQASLLDEPESPRKEMQPQPDTVDEVHKNENLEPQGLTSSVKVESNQSGLKSTTEPRNLKSASGDDDENLIDLVEVEEELSSETDETEEIVTVTEHRKDPLSVHAKPFEPPVTLAPSTKKTGLGASRFAASPPPKLSSGLKGSRFAHSPERISPTTAASQTNRAPIKAGSPPRELYEYVDPKDVELKPSETTKTLQSTTYDGVTPKLPNIQFENTPELMKSIEDSMRSEQGRSQSGFQSEESRVDGPSFEEIDAVMKQFEDNPDLGVERQGTPVKSTPLIDMRLPPNMRSDAPSPSPRQLQEGFRRASPQRRADYGLGIHKLSESTGEISDWGNDYSPRQEHKLQQRAGFFDDHVNEVVDGVIESRLEPLERSLQTIQNSIALLATRSNQRSRRSLSTDNRESDADDEDDFDDMERHSQSFRSRSPGRKDKKTDKIRNAVIDAMSAYQPPAEQSALDMTEIRATLEEMRKLSQQVQQPQTQPDFKSMIEEAISSHPRLQGPAVNDDTMAQQETNALKMEVLEKSLQEAEQRAEQEAKLRVQAEADMQALNQKLLDARDVANQHREAHEAMQQRHTVLQKEQDTYHARESTLSEIEAKLTKANDKIAKLDLLADEYRRTVEDLRDQIGEEKSRYQDLEFTLHVIKAKHDERDESRQALRTQIDRLQTRIAEVVDDMAHEDTEWRRREHELVIANQKTQSALDHEVRYRQKVESERDRLEQEQKDSERLKTVHEVSQREMERLHAEIAQLRQENMAHQDKSFQLSRELAQIQDATASEVTKATAQLQSELDAARWTVDNLKSDSEAQIKRLQARLDNAELDLEDQKAKHDSTINDITEVHNQALHEAQEKRENALQEQHSTHEKKLNDLRDRHTRALHNSSDDRHRLEYHLNEKLTFSDEKVKHLENKVTDLEERLEVTKSAARAAVEAATAKGINLPTPAPSVVASPPQRASSASMPISKVSDLPERISPQALRESIMVLQDQLQNREMKIEELQQELAAVDKDAPVKVKERENEITMLRELLSVRADDLAELISILTKSDFNRERARDAAIRLRANTQMEQQLKERAHAIGQMSMPSISSITNLASSPRALPMAAAAAWGNWRKARDFSSNALSNLANAAVEQTPSKSNSASPSSVLAGMITPPNTSQRTPPAVESDLQSPPTMRPLAAAAAAARKKGGLIGAPRPLRGYSAQPRSLSSQQADKNSANQDASQSVDHSDDGADNDSPQTPTFSRGIGSSPQNLEFGDDVDEDASPFDGGAHEQVNLSPEAEDQHNNTATIDIGA